MGPLAPGLWGVLATPYAGDDLHVDHDRLGRLAELDDVQVAAGGGHAAKDYWIVS